MQVTEPEPELYASCITSDNNGEDFQRPAELNTYQCTIVEALYHASKLSSDFEF